MLNYTDDLAGRHVNMWAVGIAYDRTAKLLVRLIEAGAKAIYTQAQAWFC